MNTAARPRDHARSPCLLTGIAAAWLLAASIGCSGHQAAVAPVSGVVRLDGKPLTGGQVTFWPAGGRSASGSIRPDGTFTLSTYRDGDGAAIGPARVTVTDPPATPSGPPDVDHDQPNRASKQSRVPARYANPDGSGLTFNVERGRNMAALDLQSR